jgi:hypothetical protein
MKKLPGLIINRIMFIRDIITRVKNDDRVPGEYYVLGEDVYVVSDAKNGETIAMHNDQKTIMKMYNRIDLGVYDDHFIIRSVNDMIEAAYAAGYADAESGHLIDTTKEHKQLLKEYTDVDNAPNI